MDVWRDRDPAPNKPYRIYLREYQTSRILRELSIQPMNNVPNQALRGGPRVIHWDESSLFVDIIISGQRYCRIYVPDETPPRVIEKP